MRIVILFVTMSLLCGQANAQIDSTLLRRIPKDTSFQRSMNMDAVYNRPFLTIGKMPVSIGGYVEAAYGYMGTDGITEGHSFGLPRLTLFVASSIHRRIRFLSEIEFEEGGKEVSIEFASVDIAFHPLLNLRGGIVMNPIGGFNQNHDGPKWEFVDRPVAMTQMLPATWSTAGFGLYGKQYARDWAWGYELYLTNGFDNTIINNEQNRTYLPASKDNFERFSESSNGRPLLTAKVAVRNNHIGEIGISYMGGVYNKFEDDGLRLDEKRRVDVVDVDINTTLPGSHTYIVGEWAWVLINVPATYSQQYGRKQQGGFIDLVQPVLKRRMLGFNQATLNVACRLEYVDWNVDRFKETGGSIADDLRAVVLAISFRPTAQTVLRANYRFQRQRDILGNPPAKTGGIQFGISTYF